MTFNDSIEEEKTAAITTEAVTASGAPAPATTARAPDVHVDGFEEVILTK